MPKPSINWWRIPRRYPGDTPAPLIGGGYPGDTPATPWRHAGDTPATPRRVFPQIRIKFKQMLEKHPKTLKHTQKHRFAAERRADAYGSLSLAGIRAGSATCAGVLVYNLKLSRLMLLSIAASNSPIALNPSRISSKFSETSPDKSNGSGMESMSKAQSASKHVAWFGDSNDTNVSTH